MSASLPLREMETKAAVRSPLALVSRQSRNGKGSSGGRTRGNPHFPVDRRQMAKSHSKTQYVASFQNSKTANHGVLEYLSWGLHLEKTILPTDTCTPTWLAPPLIVTKGQKSKNVHHAREWT